MADDDVIEITEIEIVELWQAIRDLNSAITTLKEAFDEDLSNQDLESLDEDLTAVHEAASKYG